jgi:hypothetical protein
MLERLQARYDDGAIIVVAPYMPDSSGDILRWVVRIDGVDVPEIDVRIDQRPERPDVMVMRLVYEGEEVEVGHWRVDTDSPHPAGAPYYAGSPASVQWTLGGLKRHVEGKRSSGES